MARHLIHAFFRQPVQRLAPLVFFIATLLYSLSASAQMTCTGSDKTETLALPPSITLPRDTNAAVGSLLTQWVASPAATSYFTCFYAAFGAVRSSGMSFQPSLPTLQVNVASAPWSPVYVVASNVAGVGLAVAFRPYVNGCGWASPTIENFPLTGWAGSACNGYSPQRDGGQLWAALVKTGPISAGTVASRTYAQAAVFGQDLPAGTYAIKSAARISYQTTAVKILPATCIASFSNNQTVSLGRMLVRDFSGIGSTSKAAPFSLSLDCTGVRSTVAVTFTDVANPANRGNTLPLTGSSTAAGLGVQVLRNNQPIQFGPDSAAAGNPNQIQLATVTGTTGQISFPFSARYIQTATALVPGIANSVATATFSYQ